MTISISSSGSFDKLEAFLKRAKTDAPYEQLRKYGSMGVSALSAATPTDSGKTAGSWYYEIKNDGKSWSIIWGNNNVEDGRPIAILLQHGHATRTGGFVPGQDYINPALRPILEKALDEGWKAVMQT